MISFNVALLPVPGKQGICAAILEGDESKVHIGGKLINSQRHTLTISSIGTHCGGYIKDKVQVLVECSSSECASGKYWLAD